VLEEGLFIGGKSWVAFTSSLTTLDGAIEGHSKKYAWDYHNLNTHLAQKRN